VTKREIQVRIPGPLKKLLIVDWENITRNKKILTLPRKHTVTATLDEFLKSKTRNAKDMEVMAEVVKGLKKYFERALPAILLYKFERPQYNEYVEATKAGQEGGPGFCDVYGCEHLARLFVKLPDLLAHTPMGANEMKLLQNKLAELLRWLSRYPEKYNIGYKETDRAYHEKV
jgi:mortality factor 4-like protein 1